MPDSRPRAAVRNTAALLLLLATGACATNARVSHQSVPTLREFRRVAVTNIEIRTSERSSSLLRGIAIVDTAAGDALRLGGDLLRSTAGLPVDAASPAQPTTQDRRRAEREQEERRRWVAENMIEFSNRSLLDRGFAPLDRRAVKQILEEQRLQASGLVSEESRRRVGDLLGADALFSGRVDVDIVSGLVADEVRITFTGRLVAVDSGEILLSGDAIHESAEFTIPVMRQAVGLFFERVPRLNEGACFGFF